MDNETTRRNNLRNRKRDRLALTFTVVWCVGLSMAGMFFGRYPELLIGLLTYFVLQISGLGLRLHEGLHSIKALWLKYPKVRAERIFVYVEGVKKPDWLLVTLYPLLIPMCVFVVVLPVSAIQAFFSAGFLVLWSCIDLANIIVVYKEIGDYVDDVEDGLYVL